MAARLGATCRHAREQAEVRQLDVALEVGLSEPTISKFEAGVGGWRDAERIVAAYAVLLDTTPEALWQAAIDWKE